MKSDWTRPRPIGLGCENRGMNFADSAPPRSWSYWSRLGQGGCNVLSNRNLTNMDVASITGDEILHQKTTTFVASSLPIHCWDIHNGAFLDIEKKYIYISGHVLFKLINRLTKKPLSTQRSRKCGTLFNGAFQIRIRVNLYQRIHIRSRKWEHARTTFARNRDDIGKVKQEEDKHHLFDLKLNLEMFLRNTS